MSFRQSKTYVGFKAFNGLLFVVLGAAILWQIGRVAGARFEGIAASRYFSLNSQPVAVSAATPQSFCNCSIVPLN